MIDQPRPAKPWCLRGLLALLGLAVAALVLFPVFAKTPCHRRRDSCGSNLKQLGLATLQYAVDSDQQCPPAVNPGTGLTWRARLLQYTHSETLFHCSQDPEPVTWTVKNNRFRQKRFEHSGHASYGANAIHCAPGAPHAPFDCDVALTQLTEPSSLLLLGELRGTSPAYLFPSNQHGLFVPQAQVAWRHVGGTNVAFADGHVKWLTKQQVPCTDEECVWGHPRVVGEAVR